MTWRGLIARMARVHVVLAVLAVPSVAAAQANQADFQARFDRALVVFNSPRQPEAIPQFSQLITGLPSSPVPSSTTCPRTISCPVSRPSAALAK